MQLKAETAVGLFVLAALAVLVYMSFQIGSLRFATHNYTQYCLYSHDISGLNKKADVRIAGVKVGWIEQVTFEEEQQRVKMCVMILKQYHLYEDAYGAIRQNGILGGKYLEIVPGDAHLEKLPANGTLNQPAEDSISIDILMKKINDIAGNVEDITESFKQSLGGPDGAQTIKQLLDGCVQMTERVASCAESIDRLVVSNEENIQETITDFKAVAQEIKNGIPELQQKIGQISNAIDRDFNRVASQIEELAPSLSKVLDSYVKHNGFVIKHKFRIF